MPLEITWPIPIPPEPLGKSFQVMIFAYCLSIKYSFSYWEICILFSGGCILKCAWTYCWVYLPFIFVKLSLQVTLDAFCMANFVISHCLSKSISWNCYCPEQMLTTNLFHSSGNGEKAFYCMIFLMNHSFL